MDISPAQFVELLKNPATRIIDVREPIEFYTYNIGGIHIPLGKLIEKAHTLDLSKDDIIVLVCQRGLRSETARKILCSAGFKNTKNLAGGLLAYRIYLET